MYTPGRGPSAENPQVVRYEFYNYLSIKPTIPRQSIIG
jgi:hypothetical protein